MQAAGVNHGDANRVLSNQNMDQKKNLVTAIREAIASQIFV